MRTEIVQLKSTRPGLSRIAVGARLGQRPEINSTLNQSSLDVGLPSLAAPQRVPLSRSLGKDSEFTVNDIRGDSRRDVNLPRNMRSNLSTFRLTQTVETILAFSQRRVASPPDDTSHPFDSPDTSRDVRPTIVAPWQTEAAITFNEIGSGDSGEFDGKFLEGSSMHTVSKAVNYYMVAASVP